MAGGKETPRQKMIGLMYLVLMALLAMNVSKEIINAFITLDNKLQQSNEAFLAKGSSAYARVEAANTISANPVNQFWLKKADNVRKLAEGLNTFVFDLKSTMLAESIAGPGADKMRWTEENANGRLVIKDLLDEEDPFDKKDDYDTPTNMFGGEPGSPGFLRGEEIRNRIHNYRDSLILELSYGFGNKPTIELPIIDAADFKSKLAKLKSKDTLILSQIFRNLTQPETMKNHGEDQAWQVVLFDHAPVVAAAAMFTSMQNDIRDNEASALEFVASKVEAPPVKFNKVAAISYGSQYVNQGDSVDVRVIVAAWDTLSQVKAVYSLDDSTMADKINAPAANGAASIRFSAASVGQHRVDGAVMVKQNGKDVPVPFTFKYEVGAPNATVSPVDLMVLYRGYDNKLEVAAGGYPPESINISCSGCTISKKGEFYVAKTKGTGKTATISVSAKVDGKTVPVAKKEFRVFRLPTPNAYFVNQTFDKPSMSTTVAKKGTVLKAMLGDSPLNIDYTVSSFEMIVPAAGGKVRTLPSKSARLTPDMKSAIKRMNRGGAITFTNIKAVKKGSSKPQKLGSLVFRLK